MTDSSQQSLASLSASSPSSAWRIQAHQSLLSLRVATGAGVLSAPTEFPVRSGLLRLEGNGLYLRFALAAEADAHRLPASAQGEATDTARTSSAAASAATVPRSAALLEGAVTTLEARRTTVYGSVEEFSGLLRCGAGRAHVHAVTSRSSTPFMTEGASCFALTFQAETRFTFRWPDASGRFASGHCTDVVARLCLEAVPVWAPTTHAARTGQARICRAGWTEAPA